MFFALLATPLVLFVLSYITFHLLIHRRSIYHATTQKPLPTLPVSFPIGIPLGTDPTQLPWHLEKGFQEHGDIFGLHLLTRSWVVVGGGELIKELMQNKDAVLRQYPDLFDQFLKNKGILFTNDLPRWKEHRKVVLQAMMKHSHLKQLADYVTFSCGQMIRFWQTRSKDSSRYIIDIDEEMTRLALQVISKAAFGVEINSVEGNVTDLEHWIRIVMESTNKYNSVPAVVWKFISTPQFKSSVTAFQSIQDYLLEVIQSKRRELKEPDNQQKSGHDLDLVRMLLLQQREEEVLKEKGEGEMSQEVFFSDEEILVTCLDMFLAGHETSAHTLAWACWLVAIHPQIQTEAHKEIDDELNGSQPSYESIGRLKKVDQIIKETLRLYPTVPIVTKKSEHPMTLGGYSLPADTAVMISNFRLHRNPTYWPNPEKFDPARWATIESGDDSANTYFIPFGFGPRLCVGNRMAMMQARLILAIILQNFRIEQEPPCSHIRAEANITLRPTNLSLSFQVRAQN